MGSKSSAPDYSSLANASEEAARISSELGYAQLDWSKNQYDQLTKLLQPVIDTSIGVQQQTAAQGEDYYNNLVNTYRPLEQQYVNEVQSYNTDAKREELARQAAADAGQAFTTTQQANERAMMSMGVNPNSGRFAGTQTANNLGLAATRANAMTGARETADALGYAQMLDAIGLSKGLSNASAGAYGVANNAAQSATGTSTAAGNQYLTGANSAANTINQGLSTQVSGLSNMVSTQGSVYNNSTDPLGVALGLGMSFLSSKKLKEKTGDVDAEQVSRQVERLPIDQWRYQPGAGDSGRVAHVGPYAEDMAKLGGGNGRSIDVINALGVNLAASKGLGQRVAKLERATQASLGGEGNGRG